MSLTPPSSHGSGPVTAEDINSESSSAGEVLTSNGDGTASWASGGGTPGTEVLGGNDVTIANGDEASLTFDSSSSGPTLLNRAIVASPTFNASGVYAVSVTVAPDGAITAGGSYTVLLSVSGVGIQTDSAPSTVANAQPTTAVSSTVNAAAGDSIQVRVTNNDGAASVPFFIAPAVVTLI